MEKSDKLCRLCLLPCQESKCSISGKEIRSQLEVVFKFEFVEDSSLPNAVCEVCSSKVSDFHVFHETVRANQNQLTASLEDSKVNVLLLVQIKGEPSNVENEAEDDEEEEQEPDGDNDPSPEEKADKQSETKSVQDSDDQDEWEPPAKDEDSGQEDDDDDNDNETGTPSKKRKSQDAENEKIKNFFGTIRCNICSESFESYDCLYKHSRKVHDSKWSISCCNREFKRKFLLIDHIDSHLNPNKYYCELCKKGFKTRYYLDIHNRRMHCGADANPFECEQCGKRFPNRSILNAHVLKHTKVQCSICDKPLANSASLRCHMANVHADTSNKPEKVHVCATCGKTFRSKSALEQHAKQHILSETPVERVQCPFCQISIKSKQYLRVHIKMHHSGDVRQTCDICHQVYPNRRSLHSHKSTVHVERNHECEICGKKFKQIKHLREHRAAHTGEWLYSCTVCGMTSNNNGNLYAHTKSKHPTEWAEARARGDCLVSKNGSAKAM